MFRSFRPDRIRVMGGKKGKQKARPKATGDADAIRIWAKENNIPVSDRGRILGRTTSITHPITVVGYNKVWPHLRTRKNIGSSRPD